MRRGLYITFFIYNYTQLVSLVWLEVAPTVDRRWRACMHVAGRTGRARFDFGIGSLVGIRTLGLGLPGTVHREVHGATSLLFPA
jgi:hypothetical protein